MNAKADEASVVICEDEAATLMQLTAILKRNGFEVLAISTDGREAVDQVLRERPEIVLMDINLPNMNGIEATRRILATYSTYRPCMVMLTAYDDKEHRERAMEAGANEYIVKPFSPDELIKSVREASARCQSERSARPMYGPNRWRD